MWQKKYASAVPKNWGVGGKAISSRASLVPWLTEMTQGPAMIITLARVRAQSVAHPTKYYVYGGPRGCGFDPDYLQKFVILSKISIRRRN